MLYILLTFLILLLIINYLMFKDVLSPSLLLSGVFSFATLFAILGNINWQISISGLSTLVVFGGVCLVFLGEVCVRNFAEKRKYVEFKKFNFNAKENEKIVYSNKLIWILSCFAFVFTMIYFFKTLELAKEYGYESGNGNFLQFARSAMLFHNDGVGLLSAILGFIVRGFGFVGLSIFCHNVFLADGLKKGVKENYVLIFPILFLLAINFLSTSRNGFILIIVMAFFIVIDRVRSVKKINLMKLGMWGIILVGVFFGIFLIVGQARGGTSNIFETLAIYAGSSIVALDIWLVSGKTVIDPHAGSETFVGIHQLIERFVPGYEVKSLFSEFIEFKNGSATNIFTGFRAYINDFGIGGFILITFLIGVLFTVIYLVTTYGKNNKFTCMYKCIYGYFLYGLIYTFATPELTTSLFSVTQIMDFLFIILFYVLITKVKIPFLIKKNVGEKDK